MHVTSHIRLVLRVLLEVTLHVAEYFYFSLVCMKQKLSSKFYVTHDLCIIQIYTIMAPTNAHKYMTVNIYTVNSYMSLDVCKVTLWLYDSNSVKVP